MTAKERESLTAKERESDSQGEREPEDREEDDLWQPPPVTPGPVRVTSDSNALTPFMPTYYNHACRPQPTVLIFSPPVLPPNIQSTMSGDHPGIVLHVRVLHTKSLVTGLGILNTLYLV